MPWPALIPLGHHQGKPAIPLMRPVMLIGSRHNAHLHLLSRQISKRTRCSSTRIGRVYIRDLASRTHTYVNGQEVREADLVDGDMLKLGSFTFRFQAAAGMKQKSAPDTTPGGQLDIDGGDFPLQIDERVMLIGRRAACDISLMEESCSTAHAVIFSMGGKRYVRDLGSRTGTMVNGAAVRQQELGFGDTIHIGDTDLRYQASAMSGLATAADELEDLVGTAPLMSDVTHTDEEVAEAPAEAPIEIDFDLGAVESDLSHETHAEPPTVEAEPVVAADDGAIPLAGDDEPPSISTTPVAEEEPQTLVGDNLLGEKLSSSGTGTGMDLAVREAMEMGGRADVTEPAPPFEVAEDLAVPVEHESEPAIEPTHDDLSLDLAIEPAKADTSASISEDDLLRELETEPTAPPPSELPAKAKRGPRAKTPRVAPAPAPQPPVPAPTKKEKPQLRPIEELFDEPPVISNSADVPIYFGDESPEEIIPPGNVAVDELELEMPRVEQAAHEQTEEPKVEEAVAPVVEDNAVEVIEATEPTTESALPLDEVTSDVSMPPLAPAADENLVIAEANLSDTGFGRQVSEFVAESPDPIMVEETAQTAPLEPIVEEGAVGSEVTEVEPAPTGEPEMAAEISPEEPVAEDLEFASEAPTEAPKRKYRSRCRRKFRNRLSRRRSRKGSPKSRWLRKRWRRSLSEIGETESAAEFEFEQEMAAPMEQPAAEEQVTEPIAVEEPSPIAEAELANVPSSQVVNEQLVTETEEEIPLVTTEVVMPAEFAAEPDVVQDVTPEFTSVEPEPAPATEAPVAVEPQEIAAAPDLGEPPPSDDVEMAAFEQEFELERAPEAAVNDEPVAIDELPLDEFPEELPEAPVENFDIEPASTHVSGPPEALQGPDVQTTTSSPGLPLIPGMPLTFSQPVGMPDFVGGMPLHLNELPPPPTTFGRVQVSFNGAVGPQSITDEPLTSIHGDEPGPFDNLQIDIDNPVPGCAQMLQLGEAVEEPYADAFEVEEPVAEEEEPTLAEEPETVAEESVTDELSELEEPPAEVPAEAEFEHVEQVPPPPPPEPKRGVFANYRTPPRPQRPGASASQTEPEGFEPAGTGSGRLVGRPHKGLAACQPRLRGIMPTFSVYRRIYPTIRCLGRRSSRCRRSRSGKVGETSEPMARSSARRTAAR